MKEIHTCYSCGFMSTVPSAFHVFQGRYWCDLCIDYAQKSGWRIFDKTEYKEEKTEAINSIEWSEL